MNLSPSICQAIRKIDSHFGHFFEAHLITLKLKQKAGQKLQKLPVKHYSWPFCSENDHFGLKGQFQKFSDSPHHSARIGENDPFHASTTILKFLRSNLAGPQRCLILAKNELSEMNETFRRNFFRIA